MFKSQNSKPQHQEPKKWQPLKEGSTICIVAPSGKTDTWEADLKQIKATFESWGVNVIWSPEIVGEDPLNLSANSYEKRLQNFKVALSNPDVDVIWVLRGGYGASELIPALEKFSMPEKVKLFIGFSDATCIHNFLGQRGWPTLHGPSAKQVGCNILDAGDIKTVKEILFGKLPHIALDMQPLNECAKGGETIEGAVVAGNATLEQCSLGTDWQLQTQGKFILLEDVGEPPYKIRRMLIQLEQAGIFNGAKGVIFGDFTGDEKDKEHRNLIIENFSKEFLQKKYNIPAFRCPGIGHQQTINHAIPLGTPAKIILGEKPQIIVETGCALLEVKEQRKEFVASSVWDN